MDREFLLREKEAKKNAEADKAAEKERKIAEQAAALAQRDAQRKIKPSEMFLSETDKYSQFDDMVWNLILISVARNFATCLDIQITVFT
jgi:cysteinyl-tRNA synthetase